MMGGYQLRSAEPRDGEALTRLFNAVFCSQAPDSSGGAPRSLAHWRWKYVDNGIGSHSTVAVDDAGEVAGHVGGLPFPTWCRGAVRSTNQSVDNMTHRSTRSGLQRIGLFAKLVNHWVETYFGPERDFLAWGFPSASNFRIGQKFSKYSLVRTVNALVHERAGELADADDGLSLERPARFGAEVDGLWERCQREVSIGVVRSAAYLNWRYVEHPRVAYSLHAVRDRHSAELRGICVTRRGGMAADALMIMDWLVPEGDVEASRALLASAARQAEAIGLGVVGAWFPEGLAWFRRFQLRGFLVRPTEHILVARSWDREVSIADLRRELYATAGDMDFY